ncbi:MAG: N-acetylmuramoyl-L-alanine amidase [Chthoniobacter sp.]|jgi:N-acetylmuramoyl-L-alanine amidase|nr:N-acetylmuramoyl-L-alanine amidase [Chthoniobacter sp.]
MVDPFAQIHQRHPQGGLYAAITRTLWEKRVAVSLSLFFAIFASSAFAGFSTVVIDAGHGGHDRGGIPGQRVAEKWATLEVARRLQGDLRAAGLRTVMTRSDDTFIPLGTRVAIANAQRNAVFVSIHFNSAPRSGACGFETYYYSRQSGPLAARLYSKLVRAWPSENRGLRCRGFFVIRRTRIPAVLCECGFLTNPREASLISSAAMRQRIADLLAQGIVEMSGR